MNSIRRILVTGTAGLSATVSDYLNTKEYVVECLSVRGESWRNVDFSQYEGIVHIAGVIPKAGVQVEDFYKVNRDLTLALAQKAKFEQVKHFVYLSSMAVYRIQPGFHPGEGVVEKNTPCNPDSDYGKSKYEAEMGLNKLQDEKFQVSYIRAPSIYDETNLAYFSQYDFLLRKFKVIPIAYEKCHRSSIYSGNLCELISLVLNKNSGGIYCPDDGPRSTVDYCRMIAPTKSESKLVGFAVEKVLKNHPIIKGCFGTIAYSRAAANAFDGAYRIYTKDMIIEKLKK